MTPGITTLYPAWVEQVEDLKLLILALYELACEHKLEVAKFWPEKGRLWAWTVQAIKHTAHAIPEDSKAIIRTLYNDLLPTGFDQDKLLNGNTYVADCYILWGKAHECFWFGSDRRIRNSCGYAKTLVTLRGRTREMALNRLDQERYQFCQWWL